MTERKYAAQPTMMINGMITHHDGFRQKKRDARSAAGITNKTPANNRLSNDIAPTPSLGAALLGAILACTRFAGATGSQGERSL
ncbi:MAG: hypothetical protein RIB61_08800 [Roseicyclus sp.]